MIHLKGGCYLSFEELSNNIHLTFIIFPVITFRVFIFTSYSKTWIYVGWIFTRNRNSCMVMDYLLAVIGQINEVKYMILLPNLTKIQASCTSTNSSIVQGNYLIHISLDVNLVHQNIVSAMNKLKSEVNHYYCQKSR